MSSTRSARGIAWRLLAAALTLAQPATVASGQAKPRPAMRIEFENAALPARQKELLTRYATQVVEWASTASLQRAAAEQSARPVTMERIQEIDRAWQRGGDPQGLATSLVGNDCARSLQSLLRSGGGFGEAFVTDSRGALVCASRRTSDYWQGDEAKWTRAWAGGSGAVFVSNVTRDASTGLDLLHISAPLRAEGRLVGVLTVGRLLGDHRGAG